MAGRVGGLGTVGVLIGGREGVFVLAAVANNRDRGVVWVFDGVGVATWICDDCCGVVMLILMFTEVLPFPCCCCAVAAGGLFMRGLKFC